MPLEKRSLSDHSKLTAERDAARGDLDFILNACRLESFTDGLQTAADYVRYSFGTAGRLYHVDGYMEVCKERDRYRRALEDIRRLEGKVCPEYEVCEHIGCQSSYGAWSIADGALGCTDPIDPGGFDEEQAR